MTRALPHRGGIRGLYHRATGGNGAFLITSPQPLDYRDGWVRWHAPADVRIGQTPGDVATMLHGIRMALKTLWKADVAIQAPYPFGHVDAPPVRIWIPIDRPCGEGERETVAEVVKSRLPGSWRATWHLDSQPPYAEFARKRPPRPMPDSVPWELSPDPWNLYLGMTRDGPYHIPLERKYPHFGVCALTGGGKTNVLLLAITHYRLAFNALVDVIDLKQDSYIRSIGNGLPGVRIHRDVESAMMALAEFFTSMKGIALGEGKIDGVVPHRVLIIDEFGSFVSSVYSWWTHYLGKPGKPPIIAMAHQCAMQGRTKNHRMVIGTHQFSNELFKTTDFRDLIAAKLVLGECSQPKWVTTFGIGSPRIDYDQTHVGRGVIGVAGAPSTLTEIQAAELGDLDARSLLINREAPCTWHAAGEMAPWIAEGAIMAATKEAYAGPFLPGGEFMGQGLSLVSGQSAFRVLPASPQEHPATIDMPTLPTRLTVQEAISVGILTGSYDSIRAAKSRKAGRQFPASCGKGKHNANLYYATDLEEWERGR